MAFRKKIVINLLIIGFFLISFKVLLSSYCDLKKTVYSNSTISKEKHVFGFLSEKVHTINRSMTNRQLDHEGHHKGFIGAAAAQNICMLQHIESPGNVPTIFEIPDKNLIYCPVAKIGTTFWRRVLRMLIVNDPAKYKQPYDVPIETLQFKEASSRHRIISSKSGTILPQSSFSFLFVRNPYNRLLSTFIDKLVPPNPTNWRNLGLAAISQFRTKQDKQLKYFEIDGHDVTFPEFLKYVINEEKSSRNIDGHIMSINKRCQPCTYSYKFVGRLESFKDDALFIMRKIGMNTSVNLIEKYFNEYTIDDAITDSIRSPFSWKADVVKYISWEKALQRIWLKIQMRGIIESRIKLYIRNEDLNKINVSQYIEMARKAHRESNPIELKKQKESVKMEAFASVPLSDMIAFRETFKSDFAVFGYDPSPFYLFNRGNEPQNPTRFFNYSHLN